MKNDNQWVDIILNDFTKSIPDDYRYFCIGSLSLLSFTKNNYQRPIKDVDIICDQTNFNKIKNNLIKLGYKQYTFINRRFPFYSHLVKLGSNKYYRFEKNHKNLEIMTSDFGECQDSIKVEIYPGIRFYFPTSGITESSYQRNQFKTVTPEALYCIYNLGLRTLVLVKKDLVKRRTDLEQLKKIINNDRLKYISNHIFIEFGFIKLKIPKQLLT